uniref:Muscle M-line assembly protein unc-89 n=1 Tax=Cacopsylla melanoneura TaxID=428564 RepID=A0A8D9EQ76_9HEMI
MSGWNTRSISANSSLFLQIRIVPFLQIQVYNPPTPARAPVYNPPTPARAPVYNPPTPAPVYKPPTPAPVYNPPPTPAYHPPTPAPVYNPPVAKPPTPQFTPKPSYVAAPPPPYTAPVHHVSPPREQSKLQSSFDQSSSYKQSSYQTTQKTTPPWVKSETSQNVVTPPWVKASPPPTPSHSSVSQNFSSSEDRYSSTSQQRQVPIQYNGYSKPLPPKPAGNQYYKTESQESESRQYTTPTFSPQSSVVQECFSSQTVKEYQSSGNQFSNTQQQLPGTFSESSVVEEHHLKPSVAKKIWPLVQNSSSSYTSTVPSYTPTVPNFTSEPVVESSYSYERSNTDNGFVEKEVKTQKSFQKTEKQFAYPPPCRSSLKSKIAAFEEKNYHSDYDSKFDSSDSEIRRTGSLKRPDRPSSAASYGTLPKTYGRSSSACNFNKVYETTQRQYSQGDEVIPGLKPGSPPQILHASQFKRKGYNQGDSGYMADTEDFQSKVSQDGSNFISSSNKKSMLIASSHPQPSSPRHKTIEQTNRTEQSYSKATRKHGGPPNTARNPSRFVKGEFRESDYESDYEGKIKPKWRPYDSDTEDNVTYRPVRPNLSAPKRRSFHATATQPVPCPLEYDRSPVTVLTQHTALVKYPPPPKLDYHSVQTNSSSFEPKVFEDTQSMSQSESGENFHRSMNVQQSTRIMTSGGLVDTDSLLDAERRRLQRVEDMKRRFEEKSVVEAKSSSGGELYSAPHIPAIGTTMFSSSSSAQQMSHQSFVSTSSSSSADQFFNSGHHQQLTNGGANFISENFGSPRKEKGITLTDSCFNTDPTPIRRLPIFITPLRDIAVVSGGAARFECIVQADPAPSVTWSKDNQVIHPSHQHHIEFRNGVCRLTLPHAYPFDAGTYSCTAVNAVGTVETSATLTVPGEKRSLNL